MTKPALPKVALAHFKTLTGSPPVEFDVHFNPASLEYTVANSIKDEGQGSKKKQFVDKTTAKLTMQLVFDTTDTGDDVRIHTDKVAALLKPVGQDKKKQVPPNVEFSWGLYRFTGLVEQHKETIDFFAASGVPLRASIDLSLVSQDVQFTSAKNPPASVDQNLAAEPAVVPGGGGPSGVANALGDPRAARAIGAANGSASLRFGAEAGLAIGAGVELKAEAAFSAGASAGAGIGIGGGVGIGGGAGIGGGVGIGGGIGVGIGAGASIGISASAGAAAGGAFAGLRSGVSVSTSIPSGQTLFAASASVGSVGGGAQFGFGGQAQMQGGASLGADVGVEADLNALIRFG